MPSSSSNSPERRNRSIRNLKLVWAFWRTERGRFAGLAAMTIVGSAVTVLYPRLIGYIIDVVQAGLKDPGSFEFRRLTLWAAALFSVSSVSAVLGNLTPILAFQTGVLFNWRARNQSFRQIITKGHRFANRFPSGDVIERLDQDLDEVAWFTGWGLFWPLMSVWVLLFVVVMMLRMNWQLTLFAVLPVTLMAVAWRRLQPLVEHSWRKLRERISETNGFLESSFSGIRLVKAYTMEANNGKRFRALLSDRIGWAMRVVRLEALFQTMYTSISELAVLLILVVGGTLVIRQTLTLGEFVAFYAYVSMLVWPMMGIGDVFVRVRKTAVEEERIREMGEFPPDVVPETGAAAAPEKAALELVNVSFNYGPQQQVKTQESELKTQPGEPEAEPDGLVPGPDVLKDINLVLQPGTRVGIAGTVGSGKSTVMRLLLRVAEPTAGEIRLGGRPLREYDLRALRALYGYTPQEPGLFSDSIRNNITMGRRSSSADYQEPRRISADYADDADSGRGLKTQESKLKSQTERESAKSATSADRVLSVDLAQDAATEERLSEVVRVAQLEPDLKAMPKGVDELIGERGVRLSGGQQGRVAIARALFNRPGILLLDDVTASLDAETEQQFIRDVLADTRDTTLVIVSHRLSILAACDIIHVFDQGRIVESGTHAELLSRPGLYRKLYERQLLEQG